MLHNAGFLAQKRLARGVRLNYPEAVALISDFVTEGARDGRSVADLMAAGAHVVEEMVRGLGGTVTAIEAPFDPEGGAYGHGAVHGHHHG